jgi:GrpB-like predicted nucleotidyltransferase (UPF0157 family)
VLPERIRRLAAEDITIADYDVRWPERFREERDHLRACLPQDLVGRIEHFGSTAVPGLAAKPIVDMLVEVFDLERTRSEIAPLLESQGYDYTWRPTRGDDTLPFYAWFIKRDPLTRVRTHHIHMVEPHFEHWDSLLFRDSLIESPPIAREYEMLKRELAAAHPRDRAAYTDGKSAFVDRITMAARARRLLRIAGDGPRP